MQSVFSCYKLCDRYFVVGFSIFFSRAKKTQKRNAMGNGKVIIVDLLFCLLLGWELRTLTSTLAAT